jgi:hypothetical protein
MVGTVVFLGPCWGGSEHHPGESPLPRGKDGIVFITHHGSRDPPINTDNLVVAAAVAIDRRRINYNPMPFKKKAQQPWMMRQAAAMP